MFVCNIRATNEFIQNLKPIYMDERISNMYPLRNLVY